MVFLSSETTTNFDSKVESFKSIVKRFAHENTRTFRKEPMQRDMYN